MWHQQPHVSFEPWPNCLTKSYESALMQKDVFGWVIIFNIPHYDQVIQLKCMNLKKNFFPIVNIILRNHTWSGTVQRSFL